MKQKMNIRNSALAALALASGLLALPAQSYALDEARMTIQTQAAGYVGLYSVDGVRIEQSSVAPARRSAQVRFEVTGHAEGNLCTGNQVFAEVARQSWTDDSQTSVVTFRALEAGTDYIQLSLRACPMYAVSLPFSARFELSAVPGAREQKFVYLFANGAQGHGHLTPTGRVVLTLSPAGEWSARLE